MKHHITNNRIREIQVCLRVYQYSRKIQIYGQLKLLQTRWFMPIIFSKAVHLK